MSTRMYFDPDSAAAGLGGAGYPYHFVSVPTFLKGSKFGSVLGHSSSSPFLYGASVYPFPAFMNPPYVLGDMMYETSSRAGAGSFTYFGIAYWKGTPRRNCPFGPAGSSASCVSLARSGSSSSAATQMEARLRAPP